MAVQTIQFHDTNLPDDDVFHDFYKGHGESSLWFILDKIQTTTISLDFTKFSAKSADRYPKRFKNEKKSNSWLRGSIRILVESLNTDRIPLSSPYSVFVIGSSPSSWSPSSTAASSSSIRSSPMSSESMLYLSLRYSSSLRRSIPLWWISASLEWRIARIIALVMFSNSTVNLCCVVVAYLLEQVKSSEIASSFLQVNYLQTSRLTRVAWL